ANPGAFDMPTYLRRQGVRACFATDHWEAMKVVEPGADRLRWLVGVLERWAVRRFDAIPSDDGRAVAAAVVLGRRDLLRFDAGEASARDIERAFVVTGTAHYLAVSGFNVGLAAAVVLLVTRLLGLGPRLTAVLVALVVLAYALMTELQPPVLRSAILVWVLCAGWVLGRPPVRMNSLAAAVLVILLARPGDLFTTSFQLSFAVVLGMFWLSAKIDRALWHRHEEDDSADLPHAEAAPAWGRYLKQTVSISLAAALVSVPLVAYRFHLVGWLAPVGTVLLAPLMFGLMAGSMLLMALPVPVPWVLDLLAAVPDGMARAIVGVVSALARVPGGHFYVADLSPAWLAVTYGLLAAWAWRERLGLARRLLVLASLAAAAVFLWTGGHRPPAHVRATFLAVGGGNTNLVELPNGRTLLFDAGSALTHVHAGEATIAPALWSRGIERVDAIFVSHAHFDHFKDILPVVERFGVRQVFVPPTFLRRRLRSDDLAVEALLARGVEVRFFAAGDRLTGTGRVDVRAVWPRGGRAMTERINDGSLVLALADGPRRLLLTGDVEEAAIDGLIAAEPDLRADAMLWPHHGPAPEAVERLAHHTGAGVVVISAARPYGLRAVRPVLPAAACYHTGFDGAVTVELAPDGVRVETFGSDTVPVKPAEEVTED
ncbi:MAG: ComEC/Rec2 family competence protein, partial [Planctomycetes bacterium]|nr:ComEC/Rec2 family competence protein [Planctomycetota bacterium]